MRDVAAQHQVLPVPFEVGRMTIHGDVEVSGHGEDRWGRQSTTAPRDGHSVDAFSEVVMRNVPCSRHVARSESAPVLFGTSTSMSTNW